MRKAFSFVVIGWFTVAVLGAAQTWTGQIGDSMCGAKHMPMGGKKMSDRECTQMCVKANAKYVFISGGKVYQLANQKTPALPTHAGHPVMLAGEMKGDTITVSKVEMPRNEKK